MIRLGILGTGGMAKAHAENFSKIKGVRLAACCDINAERASEFAAKFGIPAHYSNLKEMLDKEGLDAVSNVTIDAAHLPTSLEILKRKVHLLCEKPLATNAKDAWRMVAAAEKARVVNMVNFSYRGSAALQAAAKLVKDGRIGDLRHVEASYLQSWLSTADWSKWQERPGLLWRLSKKAGSRGDLGDIGVHIFDFASFAAGPIRTKSIKCSMKTFSKGIPGNTLGGMRLDANDSFIAICEFENGAIGAMHSSRWATGQGNSIRLRLWGSKGAIEVDLDSGWSQYKLFSIGKGPSGAAWRTVEAPKTPSIYQRFIKALRAGVNGQPDFAAAAKVQEYLDACFAAAGESMD